ncbi:MAG: hypothetical protein JO242_26645 [Streptosporangiaceae bacterium]|nr:hypothetical protein [Streptosporangiaceae bacterium]
MVHAPRGHRALGSWRRWRRTRPFWGGVLLVLAGLELVTIPLSGVLGHGAVKLVIYIGIGGVFGVLIGALLIASGVLTWTNPGNRVFYGIAGVVLGVLSFPASNLGGFFIGMLLAITGGSLAFAWTPLGPASSPDSRDSTDSSDGNGLGGTGAAPASGRGTSASGDRGHRMLAVSAMPLVLLAGLLGPAGRAAAHAAPAAPQDCILLIICWRDPSPSPGPEPSTASPAPTAATPPPTATPPASPGASPEPSASGPARRSPGAAPSATPPGHRASRKRSPKRPPQRYAAAAAGLVASPATSVITAGSATLHGFAYEGVVSMPVGGSARPVRMMEFTASSMELAGGVTASVTSGGVNTLTTSPSFAFDGSVVLYATKLSGCLGPLCVTLTPGNALSVLLQLASKVTGLLTGLVPVTLTNVTTDQPFVLAGSLRSGALSLGFG